MNDGVHVQDVRPKSREAVRELVQFDYQRVICYGQFMLQEVLADPYTVISGSECD